MTSPFRIIAPKNTDSPILLSVPHCGTAFPPELINEFKPELIHAPDDTDWHVDKLYDFAAEMGITMIAAHYSRWVIDLNRDPQSKPLYTDGRIITSLCPVTTFAGLPLYRDERKEVSPGEVQRRLTAYYHPYHQQLATLLEERKKKFGVALLWDCHSIRQHVPTIQADKFPDLILGDADGTSASPGLIEAALGTLDHSGYSVSHNHPFKGGYITRHFGRPAEQQHALQLEMTKVNYLGDDETTLHKERSMKMKKLLIKTLATLQEILLTPR
ncbi:MAG: N-formylglutamate amidohydrolase [Cyclobacteriaceae bacterium]|nr:N-formylglutamate amidohydrolase [Cyclobacteriaceae bacterium]